VTVPGALSGWAILHERFGQASFADLLAPAIALAEEGVPVTELTAAEWESSEDLLHEDAESARVYLPGGRAPRRGQLFRNPDLARTYRALAEQGPMALYFGTLGERIVASVRAEGY
jgi:gamma-glutamyltranspeptidase/glutathione hydrolase